ncbi:hypothetical protein AWB70_00521 [Caballeronia cordobensis]|uniref:Uncharacterized protein n=1 Tax=Caballeronia cordobensis TaxID=1353886 RepID=A0A158F3F1_CABCO|nr:hypothetical protein AWB70_00521 [Caballeronia cordobensis]
MGILTDEWAVTRRPDDSSAVFRKPPFSWLALDTCAFRRACYNQREVDQLKGTKAYVCSVRPARPTCAHQLAALRVCCGPAAGPPPLACQSDRGMYASPAGTARRRADSAIRRWLQASSVERSGVGFAPVTAHPIDRAVAVPLSDFRNERSPRGQPARCGSRTRPAGARSNIDEASIPNQRQVIVDLRNVPLKLHFLEVWSSQPRYQLLLLSPLSFFLDFLTATFFSAEEESAT